MQYFILLFDNYKIKKIAYYFKWFQSEGYQKTAILKLLPWAYLKIKSEVKNKYFQLSFSHSSSPPRITIQVPIHKIFSWARFKCT